MAEQSGVEKTGVELAKELGIPVISWTPKAKATGVDKTWRPLNWNDIKNQIMAQTMVEFSPSKGYSGGTKNQIIEATASAIIEALLAGTVNVETTQLPQM